MRRNQGGARSRLSRPALALAATTAFFASGAWAQQPNVGLSPVRAQRIANPTIGSFPAQQNDHFAWTLAVGDFNGDGRDELATGIPDDDGPTTAPVTDSGALIVSQYFSPSGLSPVKLVRQSAGLDAPEAGDRFGRALASCDFDADGFDDLAVGMPEENVGTTSDAGAVQTHYGRSAGLPGFGFEFFSQNTGGIPGDAEELDSFGYALACGDFDGDGYEDLVIGVPYEDFGTFDPGAGMIDILPGWSGGLAPDLAYSIDQNTSGIDGSAETLDRFGYSLAAGNFDNDAYTDLAIGVPGEDENGVVQILFGSASGLNGARDLFWYQEAVGGEREPTEEFGAVLAAGDFDGDGYDDLAIGVPFEAGSGSNTQIGEVKVAYGAAGGFDLSRSQGWNQDNVADNESSQAGDRFGAALAVGDFDRDGRDDLAIGSPGEDLTSGQEDGYVAMIMGTSAGLSGARARGIAAGRHGFPGNLAEHNKNFGWALAAGDFDGDGHDDLAIGTPFENPGGLGDAGAQTILYGSLFADGFETGNSSYW